MCIYDFTHCVDLGCSSRMLFFLSVFLFFSPLSFIPLFLFCVFLHSLLISGVINHRLFGWQCKTAPGAAIHQSHHPPSSQITRKNWHLLLCRDEEEKRETEIGGAKRRQETERGRERRRKNRKKEEDKDGGHQLEEVESISQTGKSSSGSLLAEEQSGTERFLKQIDDPTHLHFYCFYRLPYALMNLLLHMSVHLDWEQS